MRKAFDLRPLDFNDVLGRSFSIYTSSFVSLIRWFAIFWLLPMLAVAVLFYFALEPYDWLNHRHLEEPSRFEPNRYAAYRWLLGVAAAFFGFTTGAAGIYFIAARAYVGASVGMGELMRAVKARVGQAGAVGFLHVLTLAGWTLFCWATPILVWDGGDEGVAILLGMLLWMAWMPVTLWYLGVWGLNTVVPVLDDAEATESYGRSRYLTHGMRLRLAGLYLVTTLVVGAPGVPGLLSIPGVISANLLEEKGWALLSILAALIWQAVLLPLFFIPAVVYYFDMRCRKESYDLAVMALNFGIDEREMQRYRFDSEMGYYPAGWKGSRDRGRRRSYVRMPQQRPAHQRHAQAGMEVAQPAWGPFGQAQGVQPGANWGAPQPLPGQWSPFEPAQGGQVDQWGRPLPPPNQPPQQGMPPSQRGPFDPAQGRPHGPRLPNPRGPRR